MALCAGYIALQTELEVLVLKLEASSEPCPTTTEESLDQLKCGKNTCIFVHQTSHCIIVWITKHKKNTAFFYLCLWTEDFEDPTDFFVLPRHVELLGEQAKNCDIPVSVEKTGLEDRGQYTVSYVLFRCVLFKQHIFTSSLFLLIKKNFFFPQALYPRILPGLQRGGDADSLITAAPTVHQ